MGGMRTKVQVRDRDQARVKVATGMGGVETEVGIGTEVTRVMVKMGHKGVAMIKGTRVMVGAKVGGAPPKGVGGPYVTSSMRRLGASSISAGFHTSVGIVVGIIQW